VRPSFCRYTLVVCLEQVTSKQKTLLLNMNFKDICSNVSSTLSNVAKSTKEAVQDFDFTSAGKTIVDTAKTVPACVSKKVEEISTHYDDLKTARTMDAATKADKDEMPAEVLRAMQDAGLDKDQIQEILSELGRTFK